MSKPIFFARLAALLVVSALAGTSHAAFDPASGTIDESTGTLNASTPIRLGSNPTPTAEPICNDGIDCDTFELTLDLSAGFRSANPDFAVRFDVTWDNETDDFDVYVRDHDGNIIGQSATGDFGETVIVPIADIPSTATLEALWFAVAGSSMQLEIQLIRTGAGSEAVDLCAATGEETEEGALVIDDGVRRDLTLLGADANYGAFIQFNAGSQKQQDALIASLPLTQQGDFRKYAKSVYVEGPVWAFFELMNSPLISRIEHNHRIRLMGNTQPWATRVRVAQEPVSGGPYFDSQMRSLTGHGVTLGVIDGGLAGNHPDFAENLLHNFKLVNISGFGPAYVDVGNQNSENAAGGHGTHVTGTVGGRGNASGRGLYPVAAATPLIEGTFTGAAPDAKLVHWAHGAGLLVLSAVNGYQHILENEESFDPRMVAVNNSYGADPGPHDPASTATCLINEIVEERGITMVFAAGNDGGDGSATATSPTCKNPVPGVICVASYNDLNSGDRNAPLSGFSSRGLKSDPTDYPDIAAPGDTITSTCIEADPSTQALCVTGVEERWLPNYGTISGTSMASPHITGIVGLMKQANPNLTPGEIERIMQRTARKIGDGYVPDPQHPGTTTHFGYGSGLADFPAILADMGIQGAGLPPAGQEWLVLDGDNDGGDATDVVTVTMQDENRDGVTGINHRLTLADASAGSGIAYTIQRNVAGVYFTTRVELTDTGPVAAEPDDNNTAVASAVTLVGNVLNVFVPYSQMGFPALNEPVHNIQVVVDNGAVADIAPSDDNNVSNPLYGRPFTVQQAAGVAPPSDEKTCVLPGLTKVVSPSGQTGNGSGTGHDDLRQGWIAEPTELTDQVVFTIKVDNLSPTPISGHRWYFYFSTPDSSQRFWVAMDTATTPTPTFTYGEYGLIDGPVGVGTFTTIGSIDPASNFTTDGVITLIMDKEMPEFSLGNGDQLTGLSISIRQTSNPANGAGLTVDSGGAGGPYTLVGNDTCSSPTGVTGVVAATPSAGTSSRGGGGLGGGLLALLLGAGLLRRRRLI